MSENLFSAQYDISKKSKMKKFYESNKISIFLSALFFLILVGLFIFYIENKKNEKILLSENYVQAKIYLKDGKKTEAIKLLKSTVYANDPTYSTLCFFLILNQNLINDYKELSILFDHLLDNNKFESEIRNLLIYKKALFYSDFVNESELIEEIKPLMNKDTIWKPHALLLLGDYFASKNQYLKAKEFYIEVLSLNNLQQDLYDQARSQLALIVND